MKVRREIAKIAAAVASVLRTLYTGRLDPRITASSAPIRAPISEKSRTPRWTVTKTSLPLEWNVPSNPDRHCATPTQAFLESVLMVRSDRS